MKILIDDGMQIQVGTGIGKYSMYLLNELKKIPNVYVDLVEYKENIDTRIKARIRYIKYINSRSFSNLLQNYDTVHFTNYAMPFRKEKGIKYVVTVHDLVAYLYPKKLPIFYRIYNRIMIRNAVYRADVVITVSDSVQKEIMMQFPKAKAEIVTIYNGIFNGVQPLDKYPEFDNKSLTELKDKKFFLFVGTVEKRKNVGIVIEAFIKLKDHNEVAKDYKLVLAGRPGFGFDGFSKASNLSRWKDDIIFTGYISDSDCNRLYNSAVAFVFPSIYEGFGVPQLECMKCHLPIILSDIPTNREISGKYGEFFSLGDIDGLVGKMKLFVQGDYKMNDQLEWADKHLEKFSWDIIAKQCYQKYYSN